MLAKTAAILMMLFVLMGCSSKTAKIKGEFLSGCVQGGADKSICKCIYDHLEDVYSPEELQELANSATVASSKVVQSIVKDTYKYALICQG
jgi:hypothetical protein